MAYFVGLVHFFFLCHKRRDKGLLVNTPHSNWSKISIAVRYHSSLSYHKECLKDADILKARVDNAASRIDVMASSTLQVHTNE